MQPLRFLTNLKHPRLKVPEQCLFRVVFILIVSRLVLHQNRCCTGARETAKIEDIAKQLDFGSVTVLARLSNQQESQHQADAAAAYGRAYTEDLECIRPTSKDAAAPSQSQLTLYCEESDRDSDSGSSSSSHQVLQSTAASARPSCRRRAALDSDSDSEQVCTQRQEGLAQLPAQGPSTGVYTFDVSDSDHASDQDTPRASPRLPLEALPSRAAACQRENSVSDCSVIVLDSSEEEEHGASCHRYNYLLCRCVLVCAARCTAILFVYTLLLVCVGLPGVYLLAAVSGWGGEAEACKRQRRNGQGRGV